MLAMQVSRQTVVDSLRKWGFPRAADEASRDLPDSVDLEQVYQFGEKYNISRDELINRMGGSP